jgi:hypothetical protein
MGYGDWLKEKADARFNTTSAQEMGQVTPPSNPFRDSNQTSRSLPSHSPSSRSPSTLSINQAPTSRRQTLDVVKHQVMVNYLYQQQGNNGWRSNDESLSQGILLRLSKDSYLTHPPQLAESALAQALKNLNVQVSAVIPISPPFPPPPLPLTYSTGRNDNPLSRYQIFSGGITRIS